MFIMPSMPCNVRLVDFLWRPSAVFRIQDAETAASTAIFDFYPMGRTMAKRSYPISSCIQVATMDGDCALSLLKKQKISIVRLDKYYPVLSASATSHHYFVLLFFCPGIRSPFCSSYYFPIAPLTVW